MQLNRLLSLVLSPSDGERQPLPRRQCQAPASKSIRLLTFILFSLFEAEQSKLRRRFD
jgi:hypothetical protein